MCVRVIVRMGGLEGRVGMYVLGTYRGVCGFLLYVLLG